MQVPNGPNRQVADSDSGKLDSWKEIAAYLGKGVTTVRRWEREEGLPVRRLEHLKRGSVVAYKSELDAWRNHRTTPPSEKQPTLRRRALFAVAALLIFLILIGSIWRSRSAWNPVTETRILTAYPNEESHASFAPGGKRFAYTSLGRVYVKELDVEPPRKIYESEHAPVCCLRWSPDGSQIAVSFKDETAQWQLGLIDPTGRSFRSLGTGGPELSWKQDGSAVLYAHRPHGAPTSAIYELDLARSRSRQVSFPPPGSWGDIFGVPDADGTHLLLARYPRFGQGDVYLAKYGESSAIRLTYLQDWIVGVDWLPFGRGAIFSGAVHGQDGIFRIPADNPAEPALIVGAAGVNRYPQAVAIGNDSIRISFDRELWNTDLTLMNLSTHATTPVAITNEPEEDPDISEDGRLVFSSSRTGVNNIWVCEPGCKDARQITAFREQQVELCPRWSPDGRQIVYVVKANGQYNLVVSGALGEAPRVVLAGSGESSPSWSRDGKSIYFHSDRGGRSEIWRVAATGGSPVQITRGGGIEAFESNDGRELFFIRTNEHSNLFRHTLATGDETLVPGPVELHRRNWRLVGRAVLYWPEFIPTRSSVLLQVDLDSGQSRQLATTAGVRPVMSFSVNTHGQAVWSDTSTKEEDLHAVDLTFRPFSSPF
ncbi:MAG: LpqB family beta-propeller domain-containing protein [Acidobacteriota bacterium]